MIVRGSWMWHALLCLTCLAILAQAAPAPARISGPVAGPAFPPGIRSELWREAFDDGWSNTLFLDDVLILTHGELIEGRDALTGRVLWGFEVSGLEGYESPEDELDRTGDYVVAAAPHGDVESDDPSGDSLLVFNGRTGAILWRLTSGLYGADLPVPYLDYLGAGAERVLVHIPSLGLVRALHAANGRGRWEFAAPPGCTVGPGDADDWVVALLLTCGRSTRLQVLDPATGRQLWERRVFPLGNPRIQVSGGTIGVEGDHSFTVYDVDGRELYGLAMEAMCSCAVAATAAGFLVSRYVHLPQAGSEVVDVVDRRRRRITPLGDTRHAPEPIRVADGRLYAELPLSDDLQGFTVLMIDPATGERTPVVMLPQNENLVGLGVKTLLVSRSLDSQTTELVAYRTVPPPANDPGIIAREGVERGRWPDACALVPPSALAAEFPRARYRYLPRPAPPGLALATATGCDLIPDTDEHPVLTVGVLWVGRSEKEAETMLRSVVTSFRSPSHQIVDHESGARLYVDTGTEDTVIVRVGDTLVRMDGAGGQDAAVRLIAPMVHVLRAAR